jgi:hypothetical protein
MVYNIADALNMQRESVFHFDPGDPRKAIVNLHGDKPRIKLEQALTDGETIVGFPVLAPRGKFLGKANSYVCGIYASRVRLKGVTVFHRSACGP